MIDEGWPPAYAAAARPDAPRCVPTFRSPLPQLDVHAYTWEPFFRPRWFADSVGMKPEGGSDRDEIAGLIRVSCCRLAPRKLAAQLQSGAG